MCFSGVISGYVFFARFRYGAIRTKYQQSPPSSFRLGYVLIYGFSALSRHSFVLLFCRGLPPIASASRNLAGVMHWHRQRGSCGGAAVRFALLGCGFIPIWSGRSLPLQLAALSKFVLLDQQVLRHQIQRLRWCLTCVSGVASAISGIGSFRCLHPARVLSWFPNYLSSSVSRFSTSSV